MDDNDKTKLAESFFNELNERSIKRGEFNVVVANSNRKFALEAIPLYADSVDAKYNLVSDPLNNPKTGTTGIQLLSPIGRGGLNIVYRAKIRDFDMLNLKYFFVNLRKFQIQAERGGSIKEVRNEYTLEAENEADFMIRRGHYDGLRAEVLPILKARFKDGHCAVRICHKDEVLNDDALERSEAVDGFLHDNVVFSAVRGRGNKQRPVQIIEYIDHLIQPKQITARFSLQDIVSMTKSCLSVLDQLEKLSFIHRDIKPDNIFVVNEKTGPYPKLADFDMLRILYEKGEGSGTMTRGITWKGTPRYFSPEQAKGEEVDIQTDIHALGLTAYEWWTGYRGIYLSEEFREASDNERNMAIIKEAEARVHPPVRPTAISRRAGYNGIKWYQIGKHLEISKLERNFEALLAGMIEPDKERRYKHPRDVIGDINKMLKGNYVENNASSYVFAESRRDVIK